MDRRRFLYTLAAAAPVLALPDLALASPVAPRVLRFAHLHTAERLVVEYMDGTRYLPDALASVNHLLRDFRTGDEHVIDPQLLDLLHSLQARTNTTRPFEIISGYRSPKTNAMLHDRSSSSGVASGSLHMRGQAIDIRLADVPLRGLRDAALDVRRGGVGFYPSSNFVHVDTGRVRTW